AQAPPHLGHWDDLQPVMLDSWAEDPGGIPGLSELLDQSLEERTLIGARREQIPRVCDIRAHNHSEPSRTLWMIFPTVSVSIPWRVPNKPGARGCRRENRPVRRARRSASSAGEPAAPVRPAGFTRGGLRPE